MPIETVTVQDNQCKSAITDMLKIRDYGLSNLEDQSVFENDDKLAWIVFTLCDNPEYGIDENERIKNPLVNKKFYLKNDQLEEILTYPSRLKFLELNGITGNLFATFCISPTNNVMEANCPDDAFENCTCKILSS